MLDDAVCAYPLELRSNVGELSPKTSIPVGILDGALERGDLDSQSRRILPKLYRRMQVGECIEPVLYVSQVVEKAESLMN